VRAHKHTRAYASTHSAHFIHMHALLHTDPRAPGAPYPRDHQIRPCHRVVSVHGGPQDNLRAHCNKGGIRRHLGAQLPACMSAHTCPAAAGDVALFSNICIPMLPAYMSAHTSPGGRAGGFLSSLHNMCAPRLPAVHSAGMLRAMSLRGFTMLKLERTGCW